MSESDFPLPPPSFEFLVLSLKMQAEMRMGIYGLSQDDEGPDLRAARHAIDLLGVLAEKTRGNLGMEEQRLLENSLTELRFRFVQVTEEEQKRPAKTKPAEEPTAEEKTPEAPESGQSETSS